MRHGDLKTKLEIKIVSYEELPKEIDRDWLPGGDMVSEWANYLLFYYDGKLLHYQSDAMEPEDARFTRSLSWIPNVVMEAYELGKKEEVSE